MPFVFPSPPSRKIAILFLIFSKQKVTKIARQTEIETEFGKLDGKTFIVFDSLID